MRIIAGALRGHRLRCKPGGSFRPTGERMRESLFSSLGGLVSGAAVCDLFAGSGALGFESLSRGAEHATFVESGRKLADSIAGFKAIVAGEYDHLPEQAFYMVGSIEEAVEKAKTL